MESPTNSLKKIILSIKTKFSQRSLSNPRIIHPDLLDYCKKSLIIINS